MFCKTISAEIRGVEARKISIEADVSEGMPMFSMVGCLSPAVREAQERVRTALKNMGIVLPAKRITVNLAPANLRKESTNCDLAIAVAVIGALEIIPPDCTEGIAFVGELSLDGSIRPVRGVMEIVTSMETLGCRTCIVPLENLAEGSVIAGEQVLGAGSLPEVIAFLREGKKLEKMHINIEETRTKQGKTGLLDFSDLHGQRGLRRAAEVAAAGFHNLLMVGPPGAGKTMTAKRIPSIMPPPTLREMLDISRIHSIAGTLPKQEGILCTRPFRSPHHTITTAGLAGGGMYPVPGEISLAHHGVLFLDELPEFRVAALETLRQPMEDGKIILSRQSGTYAFPADFMLVAAMNPCKCGYYPDRNRCRCSERDVRNYLEHISQPLLDRIDLCVSSSEVTYDELTASGKEESSEQIRARIRKAQERQLERYRGTKLRWNTDLGTEEVLKYCELGEAEEKLMRRIFQKLRLTGRSYTKLMKVARTIADLQGETQIREEHLAEASEYRMPNRQIWGNG